MSEYVLDLLSVNGMESDDLLSYSEYPESLFERRMIQHGVMRSSSQPNTPGDGDCALHSCLDGYNNLHPTDSVFEDDTKYLRKKVMLSLIVELRRQESYGTEDLETSMLALHGSSTQYIKKMSRCIHRNPRPRMQMGTK